MSRVHDERRAAGALHRAALCRMVQAKNRAKGSWLELSPLELIELARIELDEAQEAIEQAEGDERIKAELGDVAAYVAMALDGFADCCCRSGDHINHCPGWFVNDETHAIERCDECGIFTSDEDVVEFLAGYCGAKTDRT